MNIKLIQSGGLAGKKMVAEINADLTEVQWESLIATLKRNEANPSKVKDALKYSLQKEEEEASKTKIDIGAIPDEHNALFEKLFAALKVEEK